MVSLHEIYRFSYGLALRSVAPNHVKNVLRLVLEPCNYWRNVEVPAVLSHLDVRQGEKVLDIGSPKLPSLFVWSRLGAEVWATDLFDYFFGECSHYLQKLHKPSSPLTYHIEVQDARQLKYPDAHFDKVYSISVLEHIEGNGDSVAMQEIARVLKPGGLCCLTVPASRGYREETISQEIYYKKPIGGEPVFYQRHYDTQSLQTRLVLPSGLKLKAVEFFAERWIPYERWYGLMPRWIKIPLSFFGPLSSWLFLCRLGPDAIRAPSAALLVLKKE